MRRFLLGGVALGAMATVSMAADLPPVYEAEPPIPTWSGFYLGANAGWTWAQFDEADGPDFFGNFDPDGAVMGTQAGYNRQFGNFVLGIEGDIGLTLAKEGVPDVDPFDIERVGIDWTASVRGRVGYAFDHVLVYGTGGIAFAGAEFDDDTDIQDETYVGWTLGAGVEAKVTSNMSIKLEYLYADYGSKSFVIDGDDRFKADLETHTVRVGFNYHFGAGPLASGGLPRFFEADVSPDRSGFYLGTHTGWVFGDVHSADLDELDEIGTAEPDGALRGIHAGHNWHMGNLLFGVEADVALSNAEENGTGIDDRLDLERVGIDWIATARGRVGFTAGRFMAFATAGVAAGGIELYDNGDSADLTRVGWTVGGGIEAKLTERTSLKLDYLYVDLGEDRITVETDPRDVDAEAHLLRIGASRRF